MQFESEHFKFVPLSEKHLEFFFQMDSDTIVMKYYRREPAKSLEDSKKSLMAYTEYTAKNPGYGALIVVDKTTNNPIGLGAIIHLDKNPINKEIEIGYRLPIENWGKGYATEISKALAKFVLENYPVSEIYGTTHPDNLASQKVLMKTGFVPFGEGFYHGGINKVFKLVK